MTVRTLALAGLAFAAGVVACAADYAHDGLGENIPRKAWTLTPEARKLLEKWKAEAKGYRSKSGRVALFARAQLKYGADHSDFLHRWYERPLHQDTAWQAQDRKTEFLNGPAWRKTAETVRLAKMDGLGVCPTQSSRSRIIPRSVEPGGEMSVLLELPYGYHDGDLSVYMKTAERALAMPNAFRIGGKVVLTRYPTVREAELDKAEAFRMALKEKYGDKFIVIYYVSAFEGALPDGPMTVAALEKAREHLRRVLRKTDGIFMSGWEVYWPRRYGAAFERDVIVPMLQAVLAEPEFASGKYLGMPMCQGHVNCYRWQYSLDPNGTQMLVDRMETMDLLRPDFILACEWDEENENTHFRPTVSSGYTNVRLMRYFADRFAGRAPETFPGDDTSVPNLVISYRKTLIAGEPVEVEIRNIPDGTFAGKTFEVGFRWKTAGGQIVKEYAPQRLSAGSAGAVRFVSPASELAAARAVVPELAVRWSGGKRIFTDGFWPLDVSATRAVDFWWIRQPLRELGSGVTGTLACSPMAADGTYRISGHVSAGGPLRSVEVLEGPDTVWMADPDGGGRPDAETFLVDLQGHSCAAKDYRLNGTIAVGTDVRTLKGRPLSNWPVQEYFTVNAKDVAGAEVAIDLPPVCTGRISLADVMKKDVVGLAGLAGANLTVTRFLSQRAIPRHFDRPTADISFTLKPVSKTSVLRIQTVDANERVWRSKPFVFFAGPRQGPRRITVFERDEERVGEVTLDGSLVDGDLAWDFGPDRGSVIAANAGRAFWGTAGGRVPQVTGFGRGESGYGDCITQYVSPSTPGWEDSAPTRERLADGRWALAFKNAEYASLPQQLVPIFSGWEVEFDICPDETDGTYGLFGCGACGVEFRLVKGEPTVSVFSACRYARQQGAIVTARGPSVAAGRWSHVKAVCDQRTLVLSVDGVVGKPVAYSGYMHNQRTSALGALNHGPNFYRGKIAGLKIKVR